MGTWAESRIPLGSGRFRIVVGKPRNSPKDVTFFRDAPTGVTWGTADPFGDATAVLTFPQLTPFEDPGSQGVGEWLGEESNVDIWWIPAQPLPAHWPPDNAGHDALVWYDPLTGQPDLIAPAFPWTFSGGSWHKGTNHRGKKIWEGFIANLGISSDDQNASLTAQCQGALFQGDYYKAKPFYPPRPQTNESLILAEFDRTKRPHLRTGRPRIKWPAGWSYRAPDFSGFSNYFDPNVKPGARWTGYTTRSTGSWDASLTSYIANLLAVMLVKPGSGVPEGNQWTLRLAHEDDPDNPGGRTPVLTVRDRYRDPDFSVWAGQPGVKLDLDRDASQKRDSIYGTGTDLAGTTWRNAVINDRGTRTDYLPLAADPGVYPVRGNDHRDLTKFVREDYIQFGNGFSQVDAADSANQMLQRDADPGWTGSITLSNDPSADISMWEITAGMTINVKGFWGTGQKGMNFHIAQTQADPAGPSMTLTVDTRYRDLLTLREAIARTRDPLTPARLLQLNRNSAFVEDIQAPWDYSAGSGFIPRRSHVGAKHRPNSSLFPYLDWVAKHPPRHHGHWYVKVNANATQAHNRWTGPVKILMSEKGTIRRSEFAVFDKDGNPVAVRFHVSLYYNNGVSWRFMPYNKNGTHLPFFPGAFQSIDPSTGQPWTTPGHDPQQSLVVGWGNGEQPAGYSPGFAPLRLGSIGVTMQSAGALPHPTGLLVDEGTWDFDCSANNPNYDHLAKAGKEPDSVISLYMMAYCKYTEPVYIQGRVYRQEPGTDS